MLKIWKIKKLKFVNLEKSGNEKLKKKITKKFGITLKRKKKTLIIKRF